MDGARVSDFEIRAAGRVFGCAIRAVVRVWPERVMARSIDIETAV